MNGRIEVEGDVVRTICEMLAGDEEEQDSFERVTQSKEAQEALDGVAASFVKVMGLLGEWIDADVALGRCAGDVIETTAVSNDQTAAPAAPTKGRKGRA